MGAKAKESLLAGFRLTECAAAQFKRLMAEQTDCAGKFLRIYVEGGGSSGMQFALVFDERRLDDLAAEFYGVTVLLDPFSANYLHSAQIDYVEGEAGTGFRLFNIPGLAPVELESQA